MSSEIARIDHLGVMRALVKVVELGSFSAAAREMHVSPSTLTRTISALEKSLNTTLLHRTTHIVALTEAGQIYHARALSMIADLDDTLRVVSDLNLAPSGPLKLTSPVAFGRRFLAPLIAPFLKMYPGIQMDLRLTDNHNDMIVGGFDLDIHEGENHLENLIAYPISRNDSLLCATPEYLAQHGHPLAPGDLSAHNCLVYVHPDSDPHWYFVREEEKHSIFPQGNLQSDNSELLLEAVCGGLGIAEFEIWLVRDLLLNGQLQIVLPDYRFVNSLTGRQIYMAYLPNRRFSTKVRVLREFLEARLQGIGELPPDFLRHKVE
ncbi:LysR family transcriptional regulator [Pseudomonas fluorescens]|uniref:HTH-type transcriptional regulator DmlR n=1 Tax=Pseudomonas fluorescens TaxID=294 RepID=A0A5E7LP20_PSEFL|nr:LysR family transcriptional regulator [Pseudomonas fluorescens]VVP15166.1 HTH-type transcriptional regulator DmlR [Pseudomonas fluorescens]